MASVEVFVDTAGFLALWDRGDEHHARAVKLQKKLAGAKRRFLTTDYVLDETATLLLLRHSHAAAVDFLDTMEKTQFVRMEWTDSLRFFAAAALFRRHADKEWSFTDCLSFVVMKEFGVHDAFTTDHHFRQAGLVPLLGA
jgi:predicted nucleic acid-binding protein